MADDPPGAPKDREPELTREEEELVKRLRAEASEVKDCATKYCFYALALSTVLLGAILPLLDKFPLAGFAAVPLVIFLLATVRISLHKYETANRHYGYELHIHRRARLMNSDGNGWDLHMRQIGWEEAFYAWRVVQPFVYKEIYREPKWYDYPWDNYVKKKNPYSQKNKQFWFLPKRLGSQNQFAYSAGDYLYILHTLLHVFAICAWLILVYMVFELAFGCPGPTDCWNNSLKYTFAFMGFLVTLATSTIIVIRALRMHAKRRILQNELLSINSCAIVWLAVVVAHYRALGKLGAKAPDYKLERYEGYTHSLVDQAKQLGDNVENIYTWIHEGPDAVGDQPSPQ
jgi:hypothetical protein